MPRSKRNPILSPRRRGRARRLAIMANGAPLWSRARCRPYDVPEPALRAFTVCCALCGERPPDCCVAELRDELTRVKFALGLGTLVVGSSV
jgi:hypothetical protein